MLVPAILYKDEINKQSARMIYDDELFLYTGSTFPHGINKSEEPHDGVMQYAIVSDDKLVGYFTYRLNVYTRCADWFGLIAFEKNNRTIGIDVMRELKRLINDYHIHRIEWRMIGGNPVEKHYDRFCQKYNGKKFVLTDAVRDKYGNYHNDMIYEIIFKENEVSECR